MTKYDDDWPRTYNDNVRLFKGLGQRDTAELVMWFVKLMSYFPKAGPMQNILGSPADPIFWASHGAWERLWHYLRIDDHVALGANVSAGTWSTWREEVDQNADVTCSWSSQAYSMLPFWELMDYETTWDIERNYWGTYHASNYQYYTNADLNRMFAPTNDALPFIFDELAWDHCDEWEDASTGVYEDDLAATALGNANRTNNPENNVTAHMGVIDDDNIMTPRGANDDVTNDDDKDLSRQDGAPSLDDDGNDDADADDGLDDDNSIGGGGGTDGGGSPGGGGSGGESAGGGSAPTATERRRRRRGRAGGAGARRRGRAGRAAASRSRRTTRSTTTRASAQTCASGCGRGSASSITRCASSARRCTRRSAATARSTARGSGCTATPRSTSRWTSRTGPTAAQRTASACAGSASPEPRRANARCASEVDGDGSRLGRPAVGSHSIHANIAGV